MTLVEKVFKLRQVSPFDKLNDSDLILTANISQVRSYKEDDVIYSESSGLYHLCVILEGDVFDTDGQKIESYFGLETIVHDTIISKSIIAKSDVTMLLISQEHILTLLYDSSHLMFGFLHEKKRV